jgi:hypothetical protein
MADNSSDTSLASIAPCEICSHYAVDEMNAHYVEHHSLRELKAWMKKNKIYEKFSNDAMKTHYRYHLGEFIKQNKINKEKEMRLQKLNENAIAAEKDSAVRVLTIQEIVYKRIIKIKEESDSVTPEEYRAMSMRRSAEIVNLAKTFREMQQLKMESLGAGKSEEEIKTAVEDFVSIMLKKATSALEGIPEAQERLKKFISEEMDPSSKFEDHGGFQTRESEEENL